MSWFSKGPPTERNMAATKLKGALTKYMTEVQKLEKNAITHNQLNTILRNVNSNIAGVKLNKAIKNSMINMIVASKNALMATKNAIAAKAAAEKAAANKAAAAKKAANNAAAKAAANKAAANAAAAAALKNATIKVNQLNKVLGKSNAANFEAAWKAARLTANNNQAKNAKALANARINRTRTFGKARYEPLWTALGVPPPQNKKTELQAKANAAMGRIKPVFNKPNWRTPPIGQGGSILAMGEYTNGINMKQILQNRKNILAGAPAFKPGSDLGKFFNIAIKRRRLNNNAQKRGAAMGGLNATASLGPQTSAPP